MPRCGATLDGRSTMPSRGRTPDQRFPPHQMLPGQPGLCERLGGTLAVENMQHALPLRIHPSVFHSRP